MYAPDNMTAETLPREGKKNLWFVITASSVGTLIEWYDFYIFGSLATILAAKFFPAENPTAAFLSTLGGFAAGFIVRPFGAIVFGRLGDLVGRKYTFLVTLILMGGSTFAIGIIPSYETIGMVAPFAVLFLRLAQGLALGGEYGGAATYVAEHSPEGKRGFYTSFIQTTATLGLFVSIGVILAVQNSMSAEAFGDWGWRVPFLLSAVLVLISIYIRMRMQESPLFSKIKSEGKISRNPIKESFGKKENLKLVLLALFGATAGQGVVWYTGQFYAMIFMERTLLIDPTQTKYIIVTALLIGTPLFVYFGWWSDKIGRKAIIMAGMLLAVVLYRPIYQKMIDVADISKQTERADQKLITHEMHINADGDSVMTNRSESVFEDGNKRVETRTEVVHPDGTGAQTLAVTVHLSQNNYWTLVLLVLVQVVLVTMVYGPIAAFLVELFPTRIRYTSMSLPYHVGNGVFGGLTPLLATSLYVMSKTDSNPDGDPLAGLWYPIGIAALTFIVGMIFLKKNPNPVE